MDRKEEYLAKVKAVEKIKRGQKSTSSATTGSSGSVSKPSIGTGTGDYTIPDMQIPIVLSGIDGGTLSVTWQQYIANNGKIQDCSLYTQMDSSKFDVVPNAGNDGDGWIRKDFEYYLEQLHANVCPKLGVSKLVVTSSYRSPEHNAATPGAATNSLHCAGLAVDFGLNGGDRYTVADEAWNLGFGGIAVGPSFVHIDIGPRASWAYDGVPIYTGPGSGR